MGLSGASPNISRCFTIHGTGWREANIGCQPRNSNLDNSVVTRLSQDNSQEPGLQENILLSIDQFGIHVDPNVMGNLDK